jgi:sensor domain CHASE-containing protein
MMFIGEAIPLLVGIVVGLLVSVVAWSALKARRQTESGTLADLQQQILLGLLLVAVFGAGVFITYLVLRF